MSVSAISNSNSTNNQINLQYRVSNLQFRQLGQDLASGNLSAAKSDFAILEQALTQSTSSPSPASNPMMQAFQQLATDLKAGDLSAAKQDFLGLQRIR